jgi:predicted tellurium resistance membrane protein TerC
VFSLPFSPAPDALGHREFEFDFSWRDLILIAGGMFLIWKATNEIHSTVDPTGDPHAPSVGKTAMANLGATIVQILILDIVFSVDSILTAVGMTVHLPVMIAAVVIAVFVMLVASEPLANFIHRNPSVIMLALGFLLMIGATLIADGFGVHVPKGYIYAAMAFSGLVETLNAFARNARKKREAAASPDEAALH